MALPLYAQVSFRRLRKRRSTVPVSYPALADLGILSGGETTRAKRRTFTWCRRLVQLTIATRVYDLSIGLVVTDDLRQPVDRRRSREAVTWNRRAISSAMNP